MCQKLFEILKNCFLWKVKKIVEWVLCNILSFTWAKCVIGKGFELIMELQCVFLKNALLVHSKHLEMGFIIMVTVTNITSSLLLSLFEYIYLKDH